MRRGTLLRLTSLCVLAALVSCVDEPLSGETDGACGWGSSQAEIVIRNETDFTFTHRGLNPCEEAFSSLSAIEGAGLEPGGTTFFRVQDTDCYRVSIAQVPGCRLDPKVEFNDLQVCEVRELVMTPDMIGESPEGSCPGL